jgi:glycosyltransferase involved in cell wall biosynthesis
MILPSPSFIQIPRIREANINKDSAGPKVLICTNTSWNILNFRSGLIKGLLEAGFEVVAAAPRDEYSGRVEKLGCRYVALPMENQGTSALMDLVLLLRFIFLYWRERPKVFLGYTIKPNIYGSIGARLFGVRIINNVSGLGTTFIRDTWLTWVVKLLYRAAFAGSHRVFFQNEDDRQLFVDECLVRAETTALLPGSGIDLLRFEPRPLTACDASAGFTFLLVARLLWDKGVGEFVRAAEIVRQREPGTRFQLLGFVDAANLTAIPRDVVDTWEAAGLVEYLGETDDVRDAIAAAGCVVLPSYREGTPRSLLEAAAMAKPLIATDVPGCREVVEHEVNGFLCRARDHVSLATAMVKILELSEDERNAMGEASRRRAVDKFDETIVIRSYLAAIASE